MTVFEVPTNGSTDINEAARRDAAAGMSRGEIAARYGKSDGWAGIRIRESGRTKGRSVATGPVPVVVADGKREVPPPARTNGTPTATVAMPATSVKTQRQRRLIVAMIVVAALVAGAVGTLSYSLTQTLASVAGTGWHAYIVPIVLDGMYLCGAICLAVDSKYLPAKLAIGVGLVASSATAWVAADNPSKVVDLELTARTLLAFTPLCLFLCVMFILHAYKVRR
jgi:hypothetical protein